SPEAALAGLVGSDEFAAAAGDRPAAPLWGLGANKALVVTPGGGPPHLSTRALGLRPPGSGGTLSPYRSGPRPAPHAPSGSGTGTYRLQFTWASFTGAARTDTITLTTTNTDSTQQTQTLTFQVAATNSPAWSSAPTSASTWPTVLPPDALTGGQDTVSVPFA